KIYAHPSNAPIPARELAGQRADLEAHGQGLLESLIDAEANAGSRMIYSGSQAVAFVPAFARYSYEVWVATRTAVRSVADLDVEARCDFARALKTVLLKYDGLWQKPFPYVMVFHQAPTDGLSHPEAH